MRNLFHVFAITSVLALLNCTKDDAPEPAANLKGELSLETEVVRVEEGDPIVVNMNLDKVFSEDLLLEAKFTDTYKNTGADTADYTPELEYSTDGGLSWESESNKLQVKLEKGKKIFKVRFPTIDDDLRELLLEDVEIVFTNKTTKIDIGTTELKAKLTMIDNDDPKETRGGGLMEFEFDDDNNYKLLAITNNSNVLVDAPAAKKIIDGEWKDLMDDIQYANSLLPKENRVKIFNLAYFPGGSLAGFVSNSTDPNDIKNNKNAWVMVLNYELAYLRRESLGAPPKAQKYNEDGIFGYTVAHEFGHLLTLARKTQFDSTVEQDDCDNFSNGEGCALDDAHLNAFNSGFYSATAPIYNEPQFVSQYAQSGIEEDIAETVATYIAQEEIPELKEDSSGALHKLYQMVNEDEMKTFREKLRSRFKIGFDFFTGAVTSFTVPNDFQFNVHEGKKVPCSHVKHIVEEMYQ